MPAQVGPFFTIAVDVASTIPHGLSLDANTFPHLARAVERITEAAHAQWRAYAKGAPLPDGKIIQPRSGSYHRSILSRSLGPFLGEVYSELAYARIIEQGAPAYDMKRILHSSLKVRISKEGKRYLIIPFRHDNPDSQQGNAMPESVHDWWQEPERKRSFVTGTYRRRSGQNASDPKTRQHVTVQGWRYSWGDRLDRDTLKDMGHDERTVKRLQGMVNFRRPNASGGGAHSQYVTFRNMVEGSPGWIRPARDGMFPAKHTAEMFQPLAEESFRKAVEDDVKAMLGQS